MFISDVLFPKNCLGCNFLGVYLCPKCREKLIPLAGDRCLYCGKKSAFGLTHPACLRRYGLDGSTSLFYYNNLMKKIIGEIKYRLAWEVWSDVWRACRPQWFYKMIFFAKIVRPDFLEPIPLHITRERERGFNQAQLIGKTFSTFLNLACSDFLVRQKKTRPQAKIPGKSERISNVKNIFSTNKHDRLINKTILLVDDVLTTGSTLGAAAKALKQNGAAKVYSLTLAKG